MIHYRISCLNPVSQFVQFELRITTQNNGETHLQLPSWRAGRYQLANYAQNIRNFRIKNSSGQRVDFQKITKDCWVFKSKNSEEYFISYEYFAAKMDAGSAWIDEEQVYINLVSCCFGVKEMADLPFELELNLPDYPIVVSTLPESGTDFFRAKDFQQLADSTILAAKKITHWEYSVERTLFHICIHGEVHFEKDPFIENFRKFTQTQILDFGEFPESEYHFIFQLLAYPHFHGVEHRKGTVITFGPAENLKESVHMNELLGVSSHELYHAWNVCRIRPIELLPYDFSRETYTKSGWMLEGITTYMGDLYLLKSGVFDLPAYLKEVEDILNRESLNEGWRNYSILESSMDLWLDGYQAGIPDRKVNIYSHGAIICFCLDIMLRSDGSGLPEVMRMAWEKYGKPFRGYDEMGLWNLILDCAADKEKFNSFYESFISGNEDLVNYLGSLIPSLGLELHLLPNPEPLTSKLGILLQKEVITKIHPQSAAYTCLMVGDHIMAEFSTDNVKIEASRINGKKYRFDFPIAEKEFFPVNSIEIGQETSLRKKWMK
jgi:predicted metalloprotease with PDZ domain